jgi:hypothetical protein
LCVVVCIGLIVLWVRSHFLHDHVIVFDIDARGDVLVFRSYLGVLNIGHHKERGGAITRFDWSLETTKKSYRLDSYPLLFRFMKRYNEFEIRYWFLVFLGVLVAALSWIRWRFSLRTLLIATAVVAALLGAVVLALR